MIDGLPLSLCERINHIGSRIEATTALHTGEVHKGKVEEGAAIPFNNLVILIVLLQLHGVKKREGTAVYKQGEAKA